jgi:hypothetical protein
MQFQFEAQVYILLPISLVTLNSQESYAPRTNERVSGKQYVNHELYPEKKSQKAHRLASLAGREKVVGYENRPRFTSMGGGLKPVTS